jgi:aspartyl-tRNA(Asn)/glutamyl-tRNA(Gln) amidotransferase subunit C
MEEIRRIAALARLEFQPAELERLGHELGKILSYIDKLSELDTSSVEPVSHVLGSGNVFREDLALNEPMADDLLQGAPERDRGFFKVPKIIDIE